MDITIVIVSIISFVLWLMIMYYIIHNAVSAALKQNDYYNKVRARFMIKKLEKEGYTKQEIVNIMDWNDDDFWGSVKA